MVRLKDRTTGITEHEELTRRKSKPVDRVLRVHAIVMLPFKAKYLGIASQIRYRQRVLAYLSHHLPEGI